MNFGNLVRSTATTVWTFAKKNAPQILTGVSLSCGISATIFAVTGTIKAVKIVEQKKKEEEKEKLTIGETIKAVWPCYLGTTFLTGLSVFTGIKALAISEQGKAAALMLYETTRSTLQEYQEKTKEIAGPKKEQQIHDAVNEEKTRKALENGIIFTETGYGNQKFILEETGQGFKATPQFIASCVNEVQHRINEYDEHADLNTITYELGLPKATLGSFLRWSKDGAPIAHYITYSPDPVTKEPIGFVEFKQFENDPSMPPWYE